MAKKGSRGLGSTVWNPFKHFLQFTGNSAQKVGSGAGKIVKTTVGTVEGIGSSLAKHTNQALHGTRRGRKGRRGSRRNTRRKH